MAREFFFQFNLIRAATNLLYLVSMKPQNHLSYMDTPGIMPTCTHPDSLLVILPRYR